MRVSKVSIRVSLFAIMGLLSLALIAELATHTWRAREVVTNAKVAKLDAVADKTILTLLQALRFERSDSLSALRADASQARAVGQKLVQNRADVDAAMRDIDRQAPGSADAELTAAMAAARSSYQALVQLRPELDEALGKGESRDAALADRWVTRADQALATLGELSAILGDRIKQLSPETRGLINIKNAAWRARATVGSAYALLTQAVARRTPLTAAETETIATELGKGDAHWASVQADARRPGVPEAIRQNVAAAQASMFSPENIAFRRSVRDGLVQGAFPVSLVEFQTGNRARQGTILTVATTAMDEVVVLTEAAVEQATWAMAATIAIIAAALLVCLGGLAVTQFRVIGPLTAMRDTMSKLDQGDLDVAVRGLDRGDEIGAMATAVQGFKDSLIRMRTLEAETTLARASAAEQRTAGMRAMADGFEQAVGGIVGLVSAAATQLQATARQMTATAAETASRSGTVAAAAGEAASNVNTVAAAAEELGSSVQEIRRQVAGSSALAQRTVHEADRTGALVHELSAAVSRIGDVVGLISTIAGQTNLLALNATIEAARAGDAGKGFAVVASEVKALAEQTARATSEISGQIAQIQASTGQAVASISGITGRIREINTSAASVAEAVEQQGAATQEIVRHVAHAARGTGEVTHTIAGLAGAAEETGAAASQVLGAASELSRQSEALTAEVTRFLATVRAA